MSTALYCLQGTFTYFASGVTLRPGGEPVLPGVSQVSSRMACSKLAPQPWITTTLDRHSPEDLSNVPELPALL